MGTRTLLSWPPPFNLPPSQSPPALLSSALTYRPETQRIFPGDQVVKNIVDPITLVDHISVFACTAEQDVVTGAAGNNVVAGRTGNHVDPNIPV